MVQELEVFFDYITYEKRYSRNTVTAYQRDLEQFSDFLEKNIGLASPLEAGHLHIRSWIVHLVEQGLTARSVHRKMASLSTFYKYMLRQAFVQHDPTAKVILPKMAKRLPSFVDERSMERLLDELDVGEGFKNLRDKTILEVLYGAGLRRSELISLKLADIDFSRRVLKINGKGGKQRIVPFGSTLAECLLSYLAEREAAFPGTTETALLLTDSGAPLYPKFVYTVVHRALSLVSTVERRSPHTLRHSFATHLANRGAELNAVKTLLGHASLASTQVYTHNTIDKLQQVYEQAHPRAKKDTQT
jgi:integrase/recombinase XerC